MSRTDDRATGPAGGARRPGRGPRRRPDWLPTGRGAGWFGTAGLINAVGTGFFYPYQLLFFRAVTGLALTLIGLCLTVATLLALPIVFQVGRVVDRFGPRTVLVAAAVLRAGAFVGYVLVHQFAAFTALAVLVAVCQRAEQTASPVLAAGAAPEGQMARWIALTKVTFNAGIGAGGLIAGVVIATAHSRSGFVAVGLVNAASFAVAALLYLPLPAVRPAAGARLSRRGRPWRNALFLRAAVANFVLMTVIVATETAVPVYLVTVLKDPSWVIGALFAVNTVLIVVLQLPAAERIRARSPLPVVVVGTLLHVGLLVVLGSVGGLSLSAQLPLLAAGMVLYTIGELLATQTLAVLLVDLSPQSERGAYQAFNQVLTGCSLALVPVLVTAFLAHRPAALWWTLTAVVLLLAADLRLLHRRRTRADIPATREAAP